jgi:hypothetical protein
VGGGLRPAIKSLWFTVPVFLVHLPLVAARSAPPTFLTKHLCPLPLFCCPWAAWETRVKTVKLQLH